MSGSPGTHLQTFEDNGALSMTINQMNLSPLGMDLGEFMTEGDLEFLNGFSMPNGITLGAANG